MDIESYKENVVRHEIGHWFVAKSLGFEVGEIKIKIEQVAQNRGHTGHAHIDLHPILTSKKLIESYLIDRVAILFSGVLFQSISDKRTTDTILDTDAFDDHSKLKELCFILRGIRYPDNSNQENELKQINSIRDECWSKAKDIYNENQILIDKLVKTLCAKIKSTNINYVFSETELNEWLSN